MEGVLFWCCCTGSPVWIVVYPDHFYCFIWKPFGFHIVSPQLSLVIKCLLTPQNVLQIRSGCFFACPLFNVCFFVCVFYCIPVQFSAWKKQLCCVFFFSGTEMHWNTAGVNYVIGTHNFSCFFNAEKKFSYSHGDLTARFLASWKQKYNSTVSELLCILLNLTRSLQTC